MELDGSLPHCHWRPPVPILRQLDPVHISFQFRNIHFNIILHFTSTSSQRVFPQVLPLKPVVISLPHTSFKPRTSHLSWLDHPNNILSLCSFLLGLEVNADKTKYMVMSRDRNAGRCYSVKIDNSSIERVEEFKYLGITLTDQNSIQEEIKSRLKLGNACYYSAQNLFLQVAIQKLKD